MREPVVSGTSKERDYAGAWPFVSQVPRFIHIVPLDEASPATPTFVLDPRKDNHYDRTISFSQATWPHRHVEHGAGKPG